MIKPIMNSLILKARNITNEAYALRHDLYRSLGNVGVHKEYTRFIILGSSRSGSNFLRGLINSHSGIVCFSELFSSDASPQWGLFGYPKSAKVMAQFREEPLKFLETHVYSAVPRQIQAVGFKLFYYHARGEKWQPVWEYLAALPDLKVIHIKRDNLLKRYLSQRRATLTNQWINMSGTSEKAPPVILNYEETLQNFERMRQWENDGAHIFRNQAQLDIHYEALECDERGEMERVQSFLGVKHEDVKPQTYKQSSASLSKSIGNYYELKEKFQGTEWEVFFEE